MLRKKTEYPVRIACPVIACIMACICTLAFPAVSNAASNRQKKLKLGTSFSVAAKNASYKSSNEEVACVNEEGLVTGKKQGKATIRIKSGNKITKRRVTVVANGNKKKGIRVCTGEMAILKNAVTYSLIKSEENPVVMGGQGQEDIRYHYSAVLEIENRGEEDAAKVTMDAKVAGEKVSLSFGKVEGGDYASAVAEGEIAASQIPELAQNPGSGVPDTVMGQLDCRRLKVYSAKMYTSYDYEQKKTSYHWATADTTPPVITGFVGKDSFNQKMPYQVVYSDDSNYDFLQHVTASDDRGGKVDLTVDTKKVKFQKPGIYTITYVAEDKAGNVRRKNAKIQVRKTKEVDQLADKVLSVITKKHWTNRQKAVAIYNYTRKHILYVGTSNKNSWEQEAIHGIRSGRGDCYTYYAVARALLTRAGIPNIEVKRYRGAGHHWWNMVYIGDGWYHYDCGPRIGGGRFCLLTDSQLTQYSRTHGNKYIWNYKKIPKSPKKKLSNIF